jgi:ribosomal protein S18 acetylase RimI-like enzyme
VRVEPASREQLAAVRAAYSDARAIQRAQGGVLWPEFPDAAILAEIDAGNLLRVLEGDTLMGVFSVAYEDPAIWGARERGAHIYLHRIARAATYAGRGLMDAVLDWARARCRATGRAGLRMDTWASNGALIAYYERRGFRLVGSRHLAADPRLPAHYHGIEVALLEEPCGAVISANARPETPASTAAADAADTSRAPRP